MSDLSDCPDDPGVPQARKRCNDSSEWLCNSTKRKRNRGEGYVSRVTGRHVAPRSVGPACRDGCYDKITMPIVRALHQQFWQIGDFALQNSYIQKNVTLSAVKRFGNSFIHTNTRTYIHMHTYTYTHTSHTPPNIHTMFLEWLKTFFIEICSYCTLMKMEKNAVNVATFGMRMCNVYFFMLNR